MKTPKSLLLASAAVLLLGSVPSARATVYSFTFSGTITSFSAFDPPNPPLPDLVSPGGPFTGYAFIDPQADPDLHGTVGFTIVANDGSVLISGATFLGGPTLPQYSFLNSSELFIDSTEFEFLGPYGTYGTAFGTTLMLSFASGTGSFDYDGDTGSGIRVDVSGQITSFQAVPELGESWQLLAVGVLPLLALRRKLRHLSPKTPEKADT